ncbi:hypothetical protein IRM63_06000 [Leuconostoc citreum]|uniref:hypothetical protein n=1 Tax=Leuconostoc citreum TaxID=33964 RepID=UPI0018871DFF|nr:hypothetical protein [Leuconostoc citreum]QOY97050.1 hypothetical protein IRM63_06000 [Leuconostoc citreum]
MYTVLDENLQVKGRLSLNNGNGATAFFSDTITTQMATDNANDPTGLITVDYTNQDKQGNTKQWSHSLTVNVEATELGTSINTTDYLMYFDSVANHYYSMKVINATTDRNSGFITVSAINAAIFELGKQLIQAEQVYKQVDLKTFVSKMYKNAPFSLRIADDNLVTLDYTVSANTSLQALLQDLQTKFDVDVDSWVEVDETGHIVDRVLYFGHLGADNGELIRYGGAKGFENMTATEVSDIIYTKLYVTGKTDDKDPNKGHIGAVNNGLEYITDDDANQLMYAIGASQQQPVYLEGTITNNLLSEPKALLEWAKQQLGIFNHPRFNYTVSPLHDQIVAIGDTVTVQDFHVKPEILVTSKVIQKTTSFASPETNTFVLGEFSSIFTDNMNKGANVITLIKKDVTVVQEAADYAKAQADAAHAQAVIAQEQAIHAQTSADGKTTSYTANSVEDLPATANNGDIAWVTLNDGTHGYTYLNGKWVEDLNPTLQKDITDGVNKATSDAKAYADQAIATNGTNVSASIKAVDDKSNKLKSDQAVFDAKAQGYANQAKSDAINSANQAVAKEIADRQGAVSALDSKTTGAINSARSDAQSALNALQVGGRNLFAWSKTLPWGFGSNSNATVTVEDFDANTKMYHIKSDKGHGQSAGMYIWGFCTDRGLPKGSNWSFSADIKGTGYINNFGAEGSTNVVTKGAIGTDWSRLSQSGVVNNADHISLIMYFDTDKSVVDIYIKLPKLEIGNMPTAYTQAPEDIVQDYTNRDNAITQSFTQYQQTNDGKVSKAQSDATQSLNLVATKVSQADYDTKTGDLDTKYTNVQQTVDTQTTEIANINKTATDQSAKINTISSDVDGTKQSISAIQTKDGQQDARMSTIETSVSGVTSTFNAYKTSNDGRLSGAESAIKQNTTDISSKVSQSDYNTKTGQIDANISQVNQKADSISQTVTQVSGKVNNLQVGGRNLVLNTKQSITAVGVNYANGNFNNAGGVWTLSRGLNVAGLVKQYGSDKTITLSFDWFATGDTLSGSFNPQWNNTPWGGFVNSSVKVSSTNTSGHVVTSVSLGQNGYVNGTANAVMFRQDNLQGNITISNVKLEVGNTPTAWSPAPEDIDAHFSTQQQTIDSINSTVAQQGTNINNVTTRVQTAEGNISTANNNISGLQSKQIQTANGLSQEVSDRKSGDNNTLQQGKDFTTSQISNSESGMKSFVNQTISGLQIGAISSDVNALKLSTQWQTVNVDDLNNMTNQGKFFIQGGNHTNAPVGGWFYLTVDKPINGRITQVAWADSNPTMQYTRILFGSNWSNWNRVVTNETVLSIFNDSWSLGTSANDGITKKLITGINGQADGTLVLSGKSVILNSDTVIGKNFIIGSANIANGAIGTAQIGEAAITSAKIANLDVSKLTGDTITGFNINANRQIKIASGGALISDVVNMDKTNFSVSAPNISSYRFSSEKYKVSTSNGIFNINSVLGVFSSDGNISVAVDTNTDPYKKGVFHSEYGGNNLMMSATNYTNGDPDEQLNMSSARLDYMYSKTGFLSDATDHTSIRANLIETTGTLNAYSGAQIPNIYSYPNLILESKNQSVYFRSGGDYRLQIRENGYIYLWNKKFGSGGSSLQVAGDGALFIQSSATKFKEDIQYDGGTSVGDKFLTLDPATWQDKAEYEARAKYRKIGTEPDHQIHMYDKRYYGLIAEDLVKAGLEEFVVRDEKTGEVNGLEYDKVAISLIPVLREQRAVINELKVEIERLKDKVK